jgi:hypothetical protein
MSTFFSFPSEAIVTTLQWLHTGLYAYDQNETPSMLEASIHGEGVWVSILAKVSFSGICLFAEANTKSVSTLYSLEGFPAF